MAGGPEFEAGAKMERIKAALSDPSAALRQVGVMLVAESQQAFRDQRFGKTEWKARPAINVLGIIQDFHEGKPQPPARRFERRPALRDKGRLAASIAWKQIGDDTVEVGSNLPYAGVHHTGGEVESQPITDQVVDRLAKWLAGKGKPYRKRLGWLFAKKFRNQRIKSKVHQRPMVGMTKQAQEDIEEVISVRILEAH